MTPSLRLVMSDIGRARFTAAQLAGAGAQLAIATVGLTDAPFVPAPTLTALPGEFRRLANVSGKQVGSDIAHLMIRDDAALAYGVRGVGLYLDDGTLLAVYGQAASIMTKSTVSSLMLALDIAFPALNAVAFTFGNADWLNPPATETARGVIEIATGAETATGTDDVRAVTPKKLAARLTDLAASLLASIATTVADYIPLAQKAQANGVATLGKDGLIPASQLGRALPVGTITLFFGAAAPNGWAVCDGQIVARSDGSGPIATPDLRGRVAVGISANRALGEAFGQLTANVNTAAAFTGVTLNRTLKTTYAGGGTQTAVDTTTLSDAEHSHQVSVDVTQPSLALLYIMKV
ncbi:MAG TPA: tail fiber protein [Sphingomonas sp.]|jgi:microcystin-dependent protein